MGLDPAIRQRVKRASLEDIYYAIGWHWMDSVEVIADNELFEFQS